MNSASIYMFDLALYIKQDNNSNNNNDDDYSFNNIITNCQ